MTGRSLLLGLAALGLVTAAAAADPLADFAARFHDETLRIDYYHGGNATDETVALDQVNRQGAWAGSRVHLVDSLDLGNYCAYLYDAASGELLWSRGFDSYFGEYRTTGPAGEGVRRTYHETVLAPCPRRPCEFALAVRQADQTLREVFRAPIDPDAFTVRREPLAEGVLVIVAHESGDPHAMVDVVILGEGYTRDQIAKFEQDLRRFTAVLLGHEPYASRADRFNVRGILAVSQDAGCDEPSRGVFARTALGCSFDALGSERYLLSEDNRAIHDIAAHAPCDALYIMVNHERYGGGGIYNFFCTFTTDNQWSEYVFLHEFGHHFAGLADEYYTSQTAYNDFYPADREPREANITRLLDPARLKWADLTTPGTPVPTPWEKADYDAMDREYQQQRTANNDRVAELMRAGAPAAEIAAAKEEGERLSRSHQERVDAYFARSRFQGQVGAFAGAGYCSEGMYRAELDCIMFTKGSKPFCAACRRGIERVIERYGE